MLGERVSICPSILKPIFINNAIIPSEVLPSSAKPRNLSNYSVKPLDHLSPEDKRKGYGHYMLNILVFCKDRVTNRKRQGLNPIVIIEVIRVSRCNSAGIDTRTEIDPVQRPLSTQINCLENLYGKSC